MHEYTLSLGTNIGERLNNLADAVTLLGRRGEITAASPVYETTPMDMDEDNAPDFLNCALVYDTYQNPEQLYQFIKQIEAALGRPPAKGVMSRIIDIDIITWSAGEYSSDTLTIPHPLAMKRLFVYKPVKEIAPGALPSTRRKFAGQEVSRFCGSDVLFANRNI